MKRRRLAYGLAVVMVGMLLWAAWLVGRGRTMAVVQPPLALRTEGLAMLENPPPELRGVKIEHTGIGDLWTVSVPGTGEAEKQRVEQALARMNATARVWWDAKAEDRRREEAAAGYFLVEYMEPQFILHEGPVADRGRMLWWKLRMRLWP